MDENPGNYLTSLRHPHGMEFEDQMLIRRYYLLTDGIDWPHILVGYGEAPHRITFYFRYRRPGFSRRMRMHKRRQ